MMNTRDVNQPPQYYITRFNQNNIIFTIDLVFSSTLGISGANFYSCLLTFISWIDPSGQSPTQIAISGSKLLTRYSASVNDWTTWVEH
jgi:hypothetical protein